MNAGQVQVLSMPKVGPAVFVVGLAVSDSLREIYCGRVEFNNRRVDSIQKSWHIPMGVVAVFAHCPTADVLHGLRSVCTQIKQAPTCVAFVGEPQLHRLLAEHFGEELPPEPVEYEANIPSASDPPRLPPPLVLVAFTPIDDLDHVDDSDAESDDDEDEEDLPRAPGRSRTKSVVSPKGPPRTQLKYEIDACDDVTAQLRIRALKCRKGSMSAWIQKRLNYPCVASEEAKRLYSLLQKLFPKTNEKVVYVIIRKLIMEAKLPLLPGLRGPRKRYSR